MQKRRQNVATSIPDPETLQRPRSGVKWYRDSAVIPLRLKVSRRGLTWVYFGRVAGKPRRKSLGKWPHMNLDAARAAATRLLDGGAAFVANPLTFGQLRAAYLHSTEFSELSPRTQRSYAWILQSKDYNGLVQRKIRELTRQDFLAIKDAIARDGRVYSNMLRPAQALCSWAVDRGFLDASPAVRLKLPQNLADAHPFTDAEIGTMMYALQYEVEEPYRTAYLLVAYSGQRPSTWTDARWSEVDLKKATLTVARTRARVMKLGRSWSIPLATQVVELLRELRKGQGARVNEWVFGYPLVIGQKAKNRIAKKAGMASEASRGTPYRFRSTFITKLHDWGVSTEEHQRLAGHASPMAGARGFYVPARPTESMRAAAQRYADVIQFISTGSSRAGGLSTRRNATSS